MLLTLWTLLGNLCLTAPDPGPAWLAPAVPALAAVWRPDLGLPGVAAPGRPDFDLGTQEAAQTILSLVTWTDRFHRGSCSRREEHTSFWTKTMVAIPGGGALGFDAFDLQEKLAVSTASGHLGNWDEPAGVRVGGAWDLLSPFSREHWASWGIEGWVPVWSDGETSLRSGLRLGSTMRLDAGAAWRNLDISGRTDSGTGLWDTLLPGGLARTWDARMAINIWDAQVQGWGGFRTIDPRGDSTHWRQFGRTVFHGVSVRRAWGSLLLSSEVRGEQGRERLMISRDGDALRSSLRHVLASARLQVEPRENWSIGHPCIWGEAAYLSLKETSLSVPAGNWLPFFAGDSAAGHSSVARSSLHASWTFFWKAFSITPQAGWSHVERKGEMPAAWTSALGNSAVIGGAASAELGDAGAEFGWNRDGSRWSYRFSQPWGANKNVTTGARHEFTISQTF